MPRTVIPTVHVDGLEAVVVLERMRLRGILSNVRLHCTELTVLHRVKDFIVVIILVNGNKRRAVLDISWL